MDDLDDVSESYGSEGSGSQESESDERGDRLSELPDSLILLILALLPMRDVVRTTVLSRRWKDLWTAVPSLDFNTCLGYFYGDRYGLVRFQNFVNRTLMFWKGAKILKFDIGLPYDEEPASSDLDSWLHFAIESEVEELYVNLLAGWDVRDDHIDTGYRAPQRLYSCSSIRKLSLEGCQLKLHGNVQWEQLKCLTIDGVPLSEQVVNRVLSGTPRLEALTLRLAESYENLNIHSSSLKMLTIEKFDDGAKDTVLTIWAPNVGTLQILGVLFLYSKCVLMNVSSLTNATVGFRYAPVYYDGRFAGFKLLGDILGQVYQTKRHVEKVTLSYWWIKMLGEMKKRDLHMLAPLSNSKFLKLYETELDEMVRVFKIFPELTMLVLEEKPPGKNGYNNFFEIICDMKEPLVTKFDTKNSSKAKKDFPKLCLLHLTTVEIAWSHYNNLVFPTIEFLLKHASKLEKMVLRVTGSRSLEIESTEKLLRIPRSSPAAEVILLKE